MVLVTLIRSCWAATGAAAADSAAGACGVARLCTLKSCVYVVRLCVR